MKKIKENKLNKGSKLISKSKTKAKITSVDKSTIAMPKEFEEDQSMNIRMKPQPYLKNQKNNENY